MAGVLEGHMKTQRDTQREKDQVKMEADVRVTKRLSQGRPRMVDNCYRLQRGKEGSFPRTCRGNMALLTP